MTNLARQKKRRGLDPRVVKVLRSAYSAASLPVAVIFLFAGRRIHPAYRMGWLARFRLAWRMYRNTKKVFTGMSYRAHLAMAVKLLETPPRAKGVVVECGSYLGGTTANLSLVCDIVGRDLVVYDSFEGLPKAQPNDKYAKPEAEGFLRGDLDVVKRNVERLGAIDRCIFRKGWFNDTLPKHAEPIVLCLLDVDFQASLDECVRNLWPHLTDKGYVFIDEYVFVDYCALFFSERYWRTYFNTKPPGLLGVGTGIGVGQYYLGPVNERRGLQAPHSVAYTRKDFSALWEYYPEERPSAVTRRADD